METTLLSEATFLRKIFDAMPTPVFVVDADVRILHINEAAATQFGLNRELVLQKRGGEALHCVHAEEDPGGCGHAPACKDCVIRNGVAKAFRGHRVSREKTRMELMHNGIPEEIHVLVTTSSFAYDGRTYALLTLENISELIRLKSLLPICSGCKKIRNDEGYWRDIAGYFSSHLDVEFSHGLCQECAKKLYPDYVE